VLTPTRRSFSVEFAALDFGQADLTRYRYRLQGFDAGWTETGSDLRVASDGNLPRGDYRLQVQSSHRQGTWSARELTLPVRVLPAWWQTWWARGLAALAALALWMGVVQLRTGGPAPEDADLVFFLIDIDHFKQVDDQHGHAAGDAVLVQMRERLQQAFRQGEHLVRWGGEEFLIVARGTSRHRATDLAERARAVLAGQPFVLEDGSLLHRSCSVGFAAFPPAPEFPTALAWPAVVDIADAALYTVKRSGRDGWLGLVAVHAESAEALRAAAALPLAEWRATGALKMAQSAGLAESAATTGRQDAP
jgi:diguanylate cyclase (GGDEF)-like protein